MIGAIWSVRWNNPYTDPPGGRPRVLIEVYRPEGHPEARGIKPPAAVQRVLDEHGPGGGYGLHWQPVTLPPKKIPAEKLAIIRRKRLKRRILRKYPLFAEKFIAEELARKPDYYNGITDPSLEAARDLVASAEEARVAELIRAYEQEAIDGMAA